MMHRYDEELAKLRAVRAERDARLIAYQLAESQVVHVLKNAALGAIAEDDVNPDAIRGALELCLDAITAIRQHDAATTERCLARMARR